MASVIIAWILMTFPPSSSYPPSHHFICRAHISSSFFLSFIVRAFVTPPPFDCRSMTRVHRPPLKQKKKSSRVSDSFVSSNKKDKNKKDVFLVWNGWRNKSFRNNNTNKKSRSFLAFTFFPTKFVFFCLFWYHQFSTFRQVCVCV
jgi:hypothetical protein